MSEIKRYKPAFPKEKLPEETKTKWFAFWDSKVAQVLESQDAHIVIRYLTYLHEWEKFTRLWQSMPLEEQVITTVNTKGATIRQIDPVFKLMMDLDAKIKVAETELGLTPRASAALGGLVGEAKQKWETLTEPEGEEKEAKIRAALEGVV